MRARRVASPVFVFSVLLVVADCSNGPTVDTDAAERLEDLSTDRFLARGRLPCCPADHDLYSCRDRSRKAATGLACHNPALACRSSSVCGQGCDIQVSGRCRAAGGATGAGGSGTGGETGTGGGAGTGSGTGTGGGGGSSGCSNASAGDGVSGLAGAAGARPSGIGSADANGIADGIMCPTPRDPLPPGGIVHVGQPTSFSIAVSPLGVPGTTVLWSSMNTTCGTSGGTFGSPQSTFTTFTCVAAGSVTITVLAGVTGTTCASPLSFSVLCQP